MNVNRNYIIEDNEGVSLRDALGNPIVKGNSYGYSQNANGLTTIVVGTVEAFTLKNKVKLKIESVRTCLYENKFIDVTTHAPSVTIRPFILFPILNS